MRSEFDFIQNIKDKYGLSKIGDDCAVLPKDDKTDMVVTADMLVEDVDFRLYDFYWSPEFLGHKALAVSLSDIAAMGATPVWAMLSIGVPETLWSGDFLDRLYEGWHALAQQFGVELIGGDVSRSPDKLVIDSIVGGEVPRQKAIRRSGARPNDLIYVSGSLGGAAYGLELLDPAYYEIKQISDWMANLQLRQMKPFPCVGLGRQLSALGIVTSMIDISDGLSSDLQHICEASGVGARIDYSKIPVDSNMSHLNDDQERVSGFVLNGGEDFELLFTAPREKLFSLKNLPVTQIGEVTSNTGIVELIRNGRTEILQPKGYSHF